MERPEDVERASRALDAAGARDLPLQGLIEVQGENDPGPFTVAITGGTGDYRGASGQAVVREIGAGVSVYKLSFDSKKHRH